jgi:flagellin
MSVINTNVSALYSQNAMKTNARSMNTAMEQLSTGTRINSAKDDAAGLAIGQNLTSQIRGLNQAVRNANDGINMMQTAEGAMVEQSNMLQRMRELAVQSANATYSTTQRSYLNTEFAALSNQIGSIASQTMWNGQALISGSTTEFKFQVGAVVWPDHQRHHIGDDHCGRRA